MPDTREVNADEAKLAAEISAEHAEKAVEQADKDETAARRAEAGGPVCPNCKGALVKHTDENPAKAGCSHCNQCGACWAPGLKKLRDGHPAPDGWGSKAG